MSINRLELKQRSISLIRVAKPNVIVTALIYTALSFLLNLLLLRLINVNFTEADFDLFLQYLHDRNLEYALMCMADMAPPSSTLGICLLLDLSLDIVSAGFIIFLLNTIRGTGACIGNLLDGFGSLLRLIGLILLESLLIYLWSLLFFFPGIIAAYRYRMAIYLLLDHPEMSIMECIRQSKRMMTGHKAELFLLDLSFIGWNFLAALPRVGYVAQIWTVPYINLTFALYYEKLAGRDIYANSFAGSAGNTPPPQSF